MVKSSQTSSAAKPASATRGRTGEPPTRRWLDGERYGRPSGILERRRVLGLNVLGGVLVRGRAGDVVAAVRVRARLTGGLVAVLRLDQELVGRSRGCLRVLPGRDLPAEHRDDLAAEQLKLVEDL